jgi:hypothetical protein
MGVYLASSFCQGVLLKSLKDVLEFIIPQQGE